MRRLSNHMLQRTGGTVAVPMLLGQPQQVVVSPPAAERGAFPPGRDCIAKAGKLFSQVRSSLAL